MSLAKPVMALGLDVFNPTLARPGAGGVAAGWTVNAGITPASSYAGPFPGHPRVQRLSIAAGAGSHGLSSSLVYKRFCANVATAFLGACWCKHSGNDGDLRLALHWFDDDADFISSAWLGAAIQNSGGVWIVHAPTATITPPAGAAYARIIANVANPASGTSTWDVAFLSCGTLDGATASYQWARYYAHPGSSARPVMGRNAQQDGAGRTRFVDTEGIVAPYALELTVAGITDAQKQAIERLHLLNANRAYDGGASAVDGGYYPLLVLPGAPFAPAAMLVDAVDGEFPLRPAGSVLYDPPRWAGTLRYLERV